uniref:HMG box domain-containing protein n=1 Tax=Psilocybe cubensis TaxID=181762 RepID=A0A8H7XTR6_PSICU
MPKAPGDKRPPNAWILFLSAKRRELVIPSIPGESVHDKFTRTIRTISAIWKATPEIEKTTWRTAAKEAKHRHLTLYPNYKFKPYRKSHHKSLAHSAVASPQTISSPSSLQTAQTNGESTPGWASSVLSGNDFVPVSTLVYENFDGLHRPLVKNGNFQQDLLVNSEQPGESFFEDWLQLDEKLDSSCGNHLSTDYRDHFYSDEDTVRPRDSAENAQSKENSIWMGNNFDDPGRDAHPVQQYTYLNLN